MRTRKGPGPPSAAQATTTWKFRTGQCSRISRGRLTVDVGDDRHIPSGEKSRSGGRSRESCRWRARPRPPRQTWLKLVACCESSAVGPSSRSARPSQEALVWHGGQLSRRRFRRLPRTTLQAEPVRLWRRKSHADCSRFVPQALGAREGAPPQARVEVGWSPAFCTQCAAGCGGYYHDVSARMNLAVSCRLHPHPTRRDNLDMPRNLGRTNAPRKRGGLGGAEPAPVQILPAITHQPMNGAARGRGGTACLQHIHAARG